MDETLERGLDGTLVPHGSVLGACYDTVLFVAVYQVAGSDGVCRGRDDVTWKSIEIV